jgi:hypothetical protein
LLVLVRFTQNKTFEGIVFNVAPCLGRVQILRNKAIMFLIDFGLALE